MKCKSLLLLIVGLLAYSNEICAQITLESGTVDVMFAEGSTSSVTFAESWTLDDFLNQTGENQNWDFSSVVWPDTANYHQQVLNYPAGTLLENEIFFQTANKTVRAEFQIQGITLTTDNYFQVSDDAVDWLGVAYNDDFDGNGTLEVGANFYTPQDRIMSFPMSFGSNWETETIPTISVNGTQVEELGERTSHEITSWGQSNAMGISADCLRDDFKTELACASGVGYCGETREIVLYCVPQTDGPLQFYMVFSDINSDGSLGNLYIWLFDSSLTTSAENETPSAIQKFSAYPNPLQDRTSIIFESNKSARLDLEVFDIMGKRVDKIVHSEIGIGQHKFEWKPGKDLPNGTYFIGINFDGASNFEKVILMR